jgi:hypothetical protein
MSTLLLGTVPTVKIFFLVRPFLEGSSVPKKSNPPSSDLGAASNPNKPDFYIFSPTKLDIEPELGAYRVGWGIKKLGTTRPTTQRFPTVSTLFSFLCCDYSPCHFPFSVSTYGQSTLFPFSSTICSTLFYYYY